MATKKMTDDQLVAFTKVGLEKVKNSSKKEELSDGIELIERLVNIIERQKLELEDLRRFDC